MNRQYKKPIRTYGKKKFKEVIISIPKLISPTSNNTDNKNSISLNKKLDEFEKNEIDNNSMYDDPFETTFDRLLKNARIPSQAPKTHNNTISLNSSSDITSETNDHKSLPYDVCNFNIKSGSKQKVIRSKVKVQSTKKTIVRKKALAFQNNEKLKVQDVSHKKYKLRKTRNNSKMTSKHLEINCLSFNFNVTNASETKDNNQAKKKDKKHFIKRRKKVNNMPSVKSFNDMEIRPCFVNVNRCNTSKWDNKLNAVENNLSKKTLGNFRKDQHKITEMDITNFEHNNTSVKHCFIKLEQLHTNSSIKPCSFGKRYENVVSSTPNGRSIRSSIHLIPLSPISIGYFEKLKDSVNKNNEVVLESKPVTNDSCKKSDIAVKCEFVDKSNTLSTYFTNISNFSKYSSNQLENIDKRNTNPLTVLSYNGNDNYSKTELLTERSLVQNISRSEIMQNDVLEKSVLKQEDMIPNIEKDKHYLRFSFDANGSHSLFGDTVESIQISSHNTTSTNDIPQVSSSNLVVDEKNVVLNTEMHFNSVKLNKKSTLNTNTDALDETKEELPTTLIPIMLTTSDASSDDIEFKVIVKEINDKSNGIMDVPEQILPDRNNALNTNNSFVNNDKKYSISSSYEVLKQLQDPIRITKKRKYTKWDLDLVTISEDCNNSTELKKKQTHLEKANKDREVTLSQKELLSLENIMEQSTNNAYVTIEKPVYLKPGKSWARSLSILNNIQTEFNLDKLSIGKGKRWRYSVQDILNMQKQGIIQSCIKKDDNNKELQINNEVINKSEHELSNNKGRTCDSILGRVSRRISVRVVPIQKTIKFIEDAPFLEAYGIVPVKSQRFTLLNNPRKSSTCNIQNDDIDGQIIEEHIVSTAREVILQRCSQEDYIPFSIYFSESYLKYCRKIGEGVYGEVFLHEQENKKSVIKIIPIEGNDYVNGEPQKKFHEILSEIVITMELYNLRFNTKYNTDGFVEVKNIKCIKGKYPERLIELWNIYDEEKRSDNDCPSMFNDDQLYIVLELGHGGQDLEAFVFNTAEEAHMLFIQAALALAVAEKAIEFEHRDLHWGNILISQTNEDYIHYKLGQKNIELTSKGVKVSIIDFTLSRVKYQGCSVFNDLASDPTLFTAQGEYQFEIYRLMRDKVTNNWQRFEPYTNVLWLHYTLDKMITAVRYRKRNLKSHKNGIIKLKELKNEILTYNSAFDFITNCDKIVDLLRINSKSATISV